MIIETKYKIGDVVWRIASSPIQRLVNCSACENTGKIQVKGEDFVCPKCNGRGQKMEYTGYNYYVDSPGTVGQVLATITDADYLEKHHYTHERPINIEYMLDITGIVSGTIHRECNLYGSKGEAMMECERRNALAITGHDIMNNEPYLR